MAEKKKLKKIPIGMYGEREKLKIGRFDLCFFDGTEEGGVWVEDTETGEGGQFSGSWLRECIEKLWEGF